MAFKCNKCGTISYSKPALFKTKQLCQDCWRRRFPSPGSGRWAGQITWLDKLAMKNGLIK